MAEDTTTQDAEDTPLVDDAREAVIAQLRAALGDSVIESHIEPGVDLWVRVDATAWSDAAVAAKAAGFTSFSFVSAIDWMNAPEGRYEDTEFDDPIDDDSSAAKPVDTRVAGGDTRFQMLARLESPSLHLGVTFKADIGDDMTVQTWSDIFPGADWHERETWEMFGINIAGHPWLRKLYLPGEFEGHPLRKDFALLARVVKPWPGVVDIEGIPEHLEAQLEADVMAAFEAENPTSSESA